MSSTAGEPGAGSDPVPLVPLVPRLSRSTRPGRPAAPVRIAHLGLGGFARSHQAWFTALAPDATDWGLAGFTGRSADLAERLRPQDGLYTLVTRGPGGTTYDVVDALTEVHAAGDHGAWLATLARPELAVVTITVTEAGYCRDGAGALDLDRADVRGDIAALRADPRAAVATAPAKLVAGLLARRIAGAGPLTILPCDNLPENGRAVRTVVGQLARAVIPDLEAWIDGSVSFASSMVDRITPRTLDADRDEVARALGLRDEAPVVTEPFAEWVIDGDFPAGRPQWEAVGARVVDDVAPYETRKLWLLNGAHTILALTGLLAGHATVAEAIADPAIRRSVEQWWDEAKTHLQQPDREVEGYRAALVQRFANPAIRHQLSQIAQDSSQKIPVRFLPVLRAERSAGRLPRGSASAIAAWIAYLRTPGRVVDDPAAAELADLVARPLQVAAANLVGFLDPGLSADRQLLALIVGRVRELGVEA